MKNIANFLFEVGMLKRTPRTGFQFLGSGAESVAEHSFRTAIIGFTLARLDGQADVGRVVQMCLFHDVPEARVGDQNYVNKKYVKVDEERAVEDLARTLPFGEDYRELLQDFSAKSSLESKKDTLDDRIEDIQSDIAEIETETEQLEQKAEQMQAQQMQQMQQQQQQQQDE